MFVWPLPEPEQLAMIYRKSVGYYQTAETELSKTSPAPAIQLQKMLSSIGKNGGRFLDVGCATGSLVYHMQNLGWDAKGIDINADAVAVGQSSGLDVYVESIEEAPFDKDYFDVIHMGDVLEHLPSPRKVMERCRHLLRDNGVVVVRAPNWQFGFGRISLVFARLTGLQWFRSEAPYHLYDFCPSAIESLTMRTGFKLSIVKHFGRVKYAYTVVNSGYLDNFKQKYKAGSRWRRYTALLRYMPLLIVLSGSIGFLWLLGILYDFIFRTRSGIILIAQKT